MQLDHYVDELRRQLATVADDDASRATVDRLSAALDATVRLVLLDALSAAADEITGELAPGSVELRLRGRDPEFVIVRAREPEFADVTVPAVPATASTPASSDDAADDASTSRTTLRLPDQLKARVERAAAAEGLSLNTWLVRAISAAVDPKSRTPARRDTSRGDSFTGWVR